MKSNFKYLLILVGISLAAQILAGGTLLSWFYIPGLLPPYFTQLFMLACINAILAVSLNLVNGLSGQFSLGHAGFMAVGAYTATAVNMFLLSSWHGTFLGDQTTLLI